MDKDKVKRGNIIVVTNPENKWFGCLLVVDGIKSWGVQAFAVIPHANEYAKFAYYRINYGEFDVVGDWPFELESWMIKYA